MKIIQIDGIKGMITAGFVCACVFAGFVISPGYAAMYLWNKYLAVPYMFPELSIFQGVLLWGIIVITYFIITGNGFGLYFKQAPEMTEDEINSIIKRAKINAKMRMLNHMASKSDKVDLSIHKQNGISGEEKETSFVSTPLNFGHNKQADKSEEDSISNIK